MIGRYAFENLVASPVIGSERPRGTPGPLMQKLLIAVRRRAVEELKGRERVDLVYDEIKPRLQQLAANVIMEELAFDDVNSLVFDTPDLYTMMGPYFRTLDVVSPELAVQCIAEDAAWSALREVDWSGFMGVVLAVSSKKLTMRSFTGAEAYRNEPTPETWDDAEAAND